MPLQWKLGVWTTGPPGKSRHVSIFKQLCLADCLWPYGLYSPWNFSGQNTGVGSLSLLQGIFPTRGSNPGLPHCRWILYQLSHKGSPNTGVGSLPLLQRIFLTQELNWGLLNCRQILYQLSYQGSPLTSKGDGISKWGLWVVLKSKGWSPHE